FLSNPAVTFGTAIAAFYLPVVIMTVLYINISLASRSRVSKHKPEKKEKKGIKTPNLIKSHLIKQNNNNDTSPQASPRSTPKASLDSTTTALDGVKNGRVEEQKPSQPEALGHPSPRLAQVYRSKLCFREFPAETLTLRSRVEQFSQSEGRTTGLHHHGYSSNVQFSQPGRACRPSPQLRREFPAETRSLQRCSAYNSALAGRSSHPPPTATEKDAKAAGKITMIQTEITPGRGAEELKSSRAWSSGCMDKVGSTNEEVDRTDLQRLELIQISFLLKAVYNTLPTPMNLHRKIITVQLINPWEQGCEVAFQRNTVRYKDLMQDCRDKGWQAWI
ncbi:hypothetical protein AMECASPLE_018847, partial [Ameca splendens]